MQLYYDGILATNVSGLGGEITLRRKDDYGNPVYSYSGTLEFNDVDADYIRTKLINDINAKVNTIEVKLIDECCGAIFLFKITSEGIEWCENYCKIKVTLTENTPESSLYSMAKSILITDDRNGFVSNASVWGHPKVAYCLEFRPAALQYIVLILGIIQSLTMFSLFMVVWWIVPILKIINKIIDILQALGSNIDNIGENVDDISDIKKWYNLYLEHVIGCGRTHPSPLVRNYIMNVTNIMNCTFSSSILNDVNSNYYNLLYFNAPTKKGLLSTSSQHVIEQNLPIKTLQVFLDEIKTAFNADWRFVGNVLYFEHKDFFKQNLPIIFDSTKEPDKVISECYKWSEENKFAFGKYEYVNDGVDWVGDEAKERFNDIIEWNNPYSPTQKDIKENPIQFGMARFRNDGIDEDVIQKFEWFYGSVVKTSKHYLLSNNGTASTPKLLIWDGASNDEAIIKYDYLDEGIWGTNWTDKLAYNLPMSFNENLSYGLYKKFFYTDNPRLQDRKYLDCNLEIEYDCDIINNLDINGVIITKHGSGIINDARINFETKTIIFNIKL